MSTELEFREFCKTQGWKCTPQRLVLYTFMRGNVTHPSVDEAWQFAKKTIPAITRESVYRILNEFASAHLIDRLDKIECAHYDSRTVPHGHLVCEKCGEIRDFKLAQQINIPEEIPAAECRHIEVRISWICPKCRSSR